MRDMVCLVTRVAGDANQLHGQALIDQKPHDTLEILERRANLPHWRIIVPGLFARPTPKWVRLSVNRSQVDHLGSEARIGLEDLGFRRSPIYPSGDRVNRHASSAKNGIAAEDLRIADHQ